MAKAAYFYKMEFKASMDIKTYVITAAVILLLFSVSNITSWLSQENNISQWAVMGLPIFCLLILAVAYGFSIKSYVVNSDELIVKRPFRDAVFQRSTIQNIETIDKSNFGFAWRLFGSGGLFGYYGIFSNMHHWRFTMYGTQSNNYVMIHLNSGKKIVLTPDEPEELVAALKTV